MNWTADYFVKFNQALLSRARHTKDRNAIIRCLYWLGIGRHNMCTKMVGIDLADSEYYMSQMRLCFAEAAAYLKYFDEIDDTETKGYILRSRANTALGQFKSASAKIRVIRQTLQILQDKEYQENAPELPWDRYIYMTHQQMASSISYSRDNDMTAQDVVAIMESAHIVHQQRIAEALSKKETPPIRSAFSCYAIEYYCGLLTLEELLERMEKLMNQADTSSFSPENMYAAISLPAFYCQYLREYPEQLSKREKYLQNLYSKVLSYAEAFPKNEANKQIFFYLRQLSTTFIETPHSISYGDFQQNIMIHFAPDVYVHSQVVGKTAAILCDIILLEEPDFFDDIEQIRTITNPDAKQQAVHNFAMNCGVLHDVGKSILSICFLEQQDNGLMKNTKSHICIQSLVTNDLTPAHQRMTTRRQRSDTTVGMMVPHGYPETYKRLACPCRQIVDVVGLIDWIDNSLSRPWLYGHPERSFDEIIQEALSLEGKRFSPLLTARLRDSTILEKIRQTFASAREEAYRQLYEINL